MECFALSDIGHDGAPALPALRRLLDTAPLTVPRRILEMAIQKIER